MSVDSTTPTRNAGPPVQPGSANTAANPTAYRRHPHDPPSLSETANDAIECFHHYARERPDVLAMCCLGVGFVLGWKLKPW